MAAETSPGGTRSGSVPAGAARRLRIRPRFRWLVALTIAIPALVAAPWSFLRIATSGDVIETGRDVEPAEAALVFGTLVNEDGTLSPKLAERVVAAVGLYRDGTVPRLIMSGTGKSSTGQDETARMRDFAVALGVPAGAITLDPLGLDSFATCDRAANVFGLRHVVVVTNEFHVARATWLCQQAGLDAVGVFPPASAASWTAAGNAREVGAAWKAVLDVWSGRRTPAAE